MRAAANEPSQAELAMRKRRTYRSVLRIRRLRATYVRTPSNTRSFPPDSGTSAIVAPQARTVSTEASRNGDGSPDVEEEAAADEAEAERRSAHEVLDALPATEVLRVAGRPDTARGTAGS